MKKTYHRKLKRFPLLWLIVSIGLIIWCALTPRLTPGTPLYGQSEASAGPLLPGLGVSQASAYPWHTDIMASSFYVGEPGSSENGYIPNQASAWDETWQQHYGGVDDPTQRSGWLPASFTPRQNPFYVALPYSDLDDEGNRKPSARAGYWSAPASPGQKSWVKDRWVEVCTQQACAYGQWEDAGPYGEDDAPYVFGVAPPANTVDLKAGIDVSPALNDYLKLQGASRVQWRFREAVTVPSGPWLALPTK